MRRSLDWKIITILGLTSISLLSVGAVGTYAAFSRTKTVGQTISVRGSCIFLKPGVWDADGAIFYLYSFDSSNTSDYAWSTAGVASGSLYAFTYPTNAHASHNKLIFARINPNGANIPSFRKDDSPKTLWNQTADLDMPTGNSVVYSITDWGTDVATGEWIGLVN